MPRFLTTSALWLTLATQAWCSLTVIVTRHAEVAPGGGRDPALTAQGRARARLLAEMLRDTPLDAIFVSGFRRTQQTAQPISERDHLPWQKRTEAADLAVAIRERAVGTILVVGHSNTVPELISLLGGPTYRIGERDFDNLFVLTVTAGQTSVIRLHYGNAGERTSIMQISFVKSGGIAGPMTRVQGTVNLQNDQPEVNGDAAYRRPLSAGETETLRAGADPAVLSQAAAQIAATQSKNRAMGDVEHYTISVKTADGRTHDVTLNTSGSPADMEGVPPAAAKFLSWLQQEARNILAEKMKAK